MSECLLILLLHCISSSEEINKNDNHPAPRRCRVVMILIDDSSLTYNPAKEG